MRSFFVLITGVLVLSALGYFVFPKLCVAQYPTVSTAIGNIDTNPTAFTGTIFGLILGISGGIALILIIISGYNYITSRGDPEKVKAANERLTSTIIGLLFIILSFTILRVIGVDILRVPGFLE